MRTRKIKKFQFKVSEHQIQRDILEYLAYQGFYCWRNNVGAANYTDKYGRTRLVKYGKPGMSDIMCVNPKDNGRFIAIEVKTPKTVKRVTDAQADFLELVKWAKGVAFVAASTDDVKRELAL